jgi:hypothetical protein
MSKSVVSEVKDKNHSGEPDVNRILRELSEQESFYFYKAIGQPTGEKADSLSEFARKIEKIAPVIIAFHYYRGDFGRWIKDTIGDSVLGYRLSDGERPTLKGEALRGFIIQHLTVRYDEFKVDFH